MPHDASCVIFVYKGKKKKMVFLKASGVIQPGTRKASRGLFGSAALKDSDVNGPGNC